MSLSKFCAVATFILMVVDGMFPTALANVGLFVLSMDPSTWFLIILVVCLGGIIAYQYDIIQKLK
ncbi:hypothetical protein MHI57_24855 [Cytobacillus sp. FSL K6-0129]|uniref:hypothetical protein n=1 Tax=Cytobacillus sp. FSL K6-0129 TaxID=2921421 RepID=UPI0030FA192B